MFRNYFLVETVLENDIWILTLFISFVMSHGEKITLEEQNKSKWGEESIDDTTWVSQKDHFLTPHSHQHWICYFCVNVTCNFNTCKWNHKSLLQGYLVDFSIFTVNILSVYLYMFFYFCTFYVQVIMLQLFPMLFLLSR